MDADGLKALFEPFAAVRVKRMFGGRGVYAEGLCFAIQAQGEVFLKVDAETEAAFRAIESSPFVYLAKGKPTPTSYWRLPSDAYDEADELRRWAALGLAAARRTAAAKAKPKSAAPEPAKVEAKAAPAARKPRERRPSALNPSRSPRRSGGR